MLSDEPKLFFLFGDTNVTNSSKNTFYLTSVAEPIHLAPYPGTHPFLPHGSLVKSTLFGKISRREPQKGLGELQCLEAVS